MVKIYQQPFAHAGTKQVIPDSSDPQGFVSNEDGFTTDYELDDTDPNYKPIERAEFNGLMNTVTEAVGELQQFGFAKWQPMQWPHGARVVEGGVVYRALNQTSQQPPHADWIDDMDAKANTSTQVIAGTGLSGGGSLAANRTLSVKYGTAVDTAAQGNDSRIVNSVQTSGDQTIAGIKTFSSFPVTPSAAPTANYQVANKKYVDDKSNLLPSMTGSITLNGTTNNFVGLTNIVTELGLEVGDVIRIATGSYNKLHTVEYITNNSSILVNYEHAGNRGNGSLKLPGLTAQATVTRIAKWFNAPLGLGQAWVTTLNATGLTPLNTTNRDILIIGTGEHATTNTNGVWVFVGNEDSSNAVTAQNTSALSINNSTNSVTALCGRNQYCSLAGVGTLRLYEKR